MKTIKNNLKAVIFDMDGTIINTQSIWQKVITDFLKNRGITTFLPEQEKLLNSMAGVGLQKSCIILKKEFNLSDDIESMFREKIALAKPLILQGVNFIEGFKDFHTQLKNNFIPTGVATNADLETLNIISKEMNFESFFGKNIYCVEHVSNKLKPDPAVFLHTAQKLNIAPQECIVFEDSFYGFQAAKKANMKCIAIKNKDNKDFLNLVDHAIDDYSQATDAIKKVLISKK